MGGAILILAIIFFFLRRRKRDDFDGDFDPDRVTGGRLPNMGLDLAGGAEVTPYRYAPDAPGATTGPPEMSQHSDAFLAGAAGAAGIGAGAGVGAGAGTGARTATSAPSAYSQPSQSHSQYAPSSSDHAYGDYAAYAGYADQGQGASQPSTSPTTSSFPGGFHPGMGVVGAPGEGVRGDFRHPSPGPSLPGTASSSSRGGGGVLPSQKEMEANRFRVANDGNNTPVLQHQDGGRLDVTPEEEPPSEIPPSYDSIPRDENGQPR